MENKVLSPEQILLNNVNATKKYATPTREHTGRGRNPSYAHDKHTIAFHALLLAEAVERYLKGDIQPIADDGLPF